jgi:hypothetical protein
MTTQDLRAVQRVAAFTVLLLATFILTPRFASTDGPPVRPPAKIPVITHDYAQDNIIGFNDDNGNNLPDEYEGAPFNQFRYLPYSGDSATRSVCIPTALAYPRPLIAEDSLIIFLPMTCDTESACIHVESMDGRTIAVAQALHWSRRTWTQNLYIPPGLRGKRVVLRIFTSQGELRTTIDVKRK